MRTQPVRPGPALHTRPSRALLFAGALLVATTVGTLLAPRAASAQQPVGNRASEYNPGAFRESATNAPPPPIAIGDGNTAANDHGPTTALAGPAGPAPGLITGPIGPSDAARVMQAQVSLLRPCYDRARATRPTLAGRIEMRVTLDRMGRVTQASADGMADAPAVAPCIATALRGLSFPRPEGNTLTLIHPITFVPPPTAPRAAPRRGRASPQRPAQPSTAQR